MSSPNDLGTICWLEIPVVSANRAAAFYTGVLGWECHTLLPTVPSGAANGSPATIHMFRKACGGHNRLRGAFIQVPEECLIRGWEAGSPGKMAVLTTFAVASIEGTLGRVVEMGGRLHSPKTAIGDGMGYLARFVDCEGNLQGIWAQS